MARQGTIVVRDYQKLMRAYREADKGTRKELRVALAQVAETVQRDAKGKVPVGDAKTAAGYKIRVRQRGVAVEQALKKTTGVHPEWGKWQMRHALVPALTENEHEIEHRVEKALDIVAGRFNRGGVL